MTQSQQVVPTLAARLPAAHQRSEIAARAAQHVHDLEMALEAAQADIHALTARLAVAEERARAINEENARLMADRDYHKERCVRIETHLNSAANLILDAMRVPSKREDAEQEAAPMLTDDHLRTVSGPQRAEGVTTTFGPVLDAMQPQNAERKNGAKKKNGDSPQ